MGDDRFIERGTHDQLLGEPRVKTNGGEDVDFDPDAPTARAPWPRATVAEAQLLFEVTQTSGATATTTSTTGDGNAAAVTLRPLDESADSDVGAIGARRIVSPSKTQKEGGGARFRAVAGSTHETIHAPHLVRSFSSSSISPDIPTRGLVRAAPLPQEDTMATNEYHPRGKVQNLSHLLKARLSLASLKSEQGWEGDQYESEDPRARADMAYARKSGHHDTAKSHSQLHSRSRTSPGPVTMSPYAYDEHDPFQRHPSRHSHPAYRQSDLQTMGSPTMESLAKPKRKYTKKSPGHVTLSETPEPEPMDHSTEMMLQSDRGLILKTQIPKKGRPISKHAGTPQSTPTLSSFGVLPASHPYFKAKSTTSSHTDPSLPDRQTIHRSSSQESFMSSPPYPSNPQHHQFAKSQERYSLAPVRRRPGRPPLASTLARHAHTLSQSSLQPGPFSVSRPYHLPPNVTSAQDLTLLHSIQELPRYQPLSSPPNRGSQLPESAMRVPKNRHSYPLPSKLQRQQYHQSHGQSTITASPLEYDHLDQDEYFHEQSHSALAIGGQSSFAEGLPVGMNRRKRSSSGAEKRWPMARVEEGDMEGEPFQTAGRRNYPDYDDDDEMDVEFAQGRSRKRISRTDSDLSTQNFSGQPQEQSTDSTWREATPRRRPHSLVVLPHGQSEIVLQRYSDSSQSHMNVLDTERGLPPEHQPIREARVGRTFSNPRIFSNISVISTISTFNTYNTLSAFQSPRFSASASFIFSTRVDPLVHREPRELCHQHHVDNYQTEDLITRAERLSETLSLPEYGARCLGADAGSSGIDLTLTNSSLGSRPKAGAVSNQPSYPSSGKVLTKRTTRKGTGPFLKKHQILQQQLQQMQREHEEIEYKLALQQQQQSQKQTQHPQLGSQDPTLHFQLHQQQQQLQVLQQRQLELQQRQKRQEAELEKQYQRHQGSSHGRAKDDRERRLEYGHHPQQPQPGRPPKQRVLSRSESASSSTVQGLLQSPAFHHSPTQSSSSSSLTSAQTPTRRRQVQHQPILLRPVVLPTSSAYDAIGASRADGVSSSSSSSLAKNRHSPLYHNVPPPGQPLYRSLHAPYLMSPSSLDFSAKAASSSPLSSPTTIASASPTLTSRNVVVTPPTGQQQQQREREIRRSWESMGGLQEVTSGGQMRQEDEFDEASRHSSTVQQQQQPSTPLRRSLSKGSVSGRAMNPGTNTVGQRQATPFSSLPPTYHSHHRHTASLPSLHYYQQHALTGHSPSRPGSTSLESLPEGSVSSLPPTPQGVSQSYHDTTGIAEPHHSPFHTHDSPGHKMGDQDHKQATMARSVRSMPTPSTSSTSLAPQESQYAPGGMATSAQGGMATASTSSSSSDESVQRFLVRTPPGDH
ncbi:hypothetical protein BGZ92_002497 [Podila epicladia]|nr:hypothetical protein BGZ92_002497 [Podila epicladia]